MKGKEQMTSKQNRREADARRWEKHGSEVSARRRAKYAAKGPSEAKQRQSQFEAIDTRVEGLSVARLAILAGTTVSPLDLPTDRRDDEYANIDYNPENDEAGYHPPVKFPLGVATIFGERNESGYSHNIIGEAWWGGKDRPSKADRAYTSEGDNATQEELVTEYETRTAQPFDPGENLLSFAGGRVPKGANTRATLPNFGRQLPEAIRNLRRSQYPPAPPTRPRRFAALRATPATPNYPGGLAPRGLGFEGGELHPKDDSVTAAEARYHDRYNVYPGTEASAFQRPDSWTYETQP